MTELTKTTERSDNWREGQAKAESAFAKDIHDAWSDPRNQEKHPPKKPEADKKPDGGEAGLKEGDGLTDREEVFKYEKPHTSPKTPAADKKTEGSLPKVIIVGQGMLIAPDKTKEEVEAMLKDRLDRLGKASEEFQKKADEYQGPPHKPDTIQPGGPHWIKQPEKNPDTEGRNPPDRRPNYPGAEWLKPTLPETKPNPDGRHPMVKPRPGFDPSEYFKKFFDGK